jgi:fructokinase
MRILSFGEILFDIIEGEHYLGGAPLNFAGHLAQFGTAAAPVKSYILSAVGTDGLGERALQEIDRLGVNTSLVQQKEEHPTGTVPVVIRNGQPDYTILEHVAYDFIALPENELAREEPFDVLYFGTLAQRSEQSRQTLRQLLARNSFKQVFYDINLRKDSYTKQLILESLQHCTILKLNDEEVEVLSQLLYQQELGIEEFAKRVAREHGIDVVVITAGAEGCYVLEDEAFSFVKGYPAKVVDTVGAGDSFSAAFVYHYFRTNDPVYAADIANRLGAFVASSRGPLPPYTPEIRRLLEL